MNTYPIATIALLLAGPFNDFLSPGGKLYDLTKSTMEDTNPIANIQQLIAAVSAHHMPVVYVPHHHIKEGDYRNWKFMVHTGSKQVMPAAHTSLWP